MTATNDVSATRLSPGLAVFGSFLWIVVASPTLVESDAYRYATVLLLLIGWHFYRRMPVRPETNWIGWLCIAWGLYVLARFAVILAVTPHHDIGASDWLYAFPMFFPMLGFAFSLYSKYCERIIAAFFAVALVMLAVTTHYGQIFAGETVRPLIMNNQIHGAVACGMLIVWTCFWLLYYLTDKSSDRAFARFSYIAAPIIILLCLIAIYGAKSKGVWLALGISLPVLGLVALTYIKRGLGLVVIACSVALLLVGVYGVRHNLYKTAGPTVASTLSMAGAIAEGNGLDQAVSGTIDSDETPVSMDERLQLWSNGWEVFSSAPIFGWGNEWLERWRQTRYANVHYTLLHNGYLEMLVRFGLFGALTMLVMLIALMKSVWRAYFAGIIPRAVCHAYTLTLFFISLTILSNSNNRLAIGESLALGSSAFAYWCSLQLRQRSKSLVERTAGRDEKDVAPQAVQAS